MRDRWMAKMDRIGRSHGAKRGRRSVQFTVKGRDEYGQPRQEVITVSIDWRKFKRIMRKTPHPRYEGGLEGFLGV